MEKSKKSILEATQLYAESTESSNAKKHIHNAAATFLNTFHCFTGDDIDTDPDALEVIHKVKEALLYADNYVLKRYCANDELNTNNSKPEKTIPPEKKEPIEDKRSIVKDKNEQATVKAKQVNPNISPKFFNSIMKFFDYRGSGFVMKIGLVDSDEYMFRVFIVPEEDIDNTKNPKVLWWELCKNGMDALRIITKFNINDYLLVQLSNGRNCFMKIK